MEAILDEFDHYLELQCLRSAHTRRAYRGDLRSLFAFLGERAPGSGLQGLSDPLSSVAYASVVVRSSRPTKGARRSVAARMGSP